MANCRIDIIPEGASSATDSDFVVKLIDVFPDDYQYPETGNKLLEIWANNVTIQNDFIDVYNAGTAYTFAAAVYLNDNGTTASDNITSYTIDHNILNEGIIVANGVGDPSLGIGASQLVTNNAFIGTFDYGTGEGRYDTVAITETLFELKFAT